MPTSAPPTLLRGILPDAVRVVETTGDRVDAVLFPAESARVAAAVPARQREFATTRACAREALAQLGVAPGPILAGPRGEPTWPPGIVGSMTHCTGYRGVALAHRRDVTALGIDAEPDAPLPDGVLDLVASAAERAMVADLRERAPLAWDRLLFSAKESVYKAWFPLTHRWLDFHEAVVDLSESGFAATLLVPGPVTRLCGRWCGRDGLLVTAVVLG